MTSNKILLSLTMTAGLFAIGCGASGDDPTASEHEHTATQEATATAEVTATQSDATATPEGTTPTATPVTPGPTVAVTFTVNTNTSADGVNALAKVLEGESVYIVGDFAPAGVNCWDSPPYENYPCWTPLDDALAMSDNGDGTHSITLDLNPGANIEYKFLKSKPEGADDDWANGMKTYTLISEQVCPAYEEVAEDDRPEGGLWEVQNFSYTIPSEDTSVDTVDIDAWRDYAAEFGYLSCD